MARVLIVSTNRERTPFPVMPVGPALVAAHAQRAGHDVRVLDLMFEKDPEQAASHAVASFDPEVIGVGMRNIDNSDLIETKYYVPDVERMLGAIRSAAPRTPIVLGGAATSIEPEALLGLWGPAGSFAAGRSAPLVDMILTGDAEKRFPLLLDRLLSGAPADDVSGLCRPGPDGGARWNRIGLAEPIDDLADARLFDVVDVKRYARADGVYPIQTKRGCAFTCTYCTYGSLEGLRTRYRPVAEIVDEIERAADRGVVHFEFVDAVFSHPPVQARAVCEELIRRGLPRRIALTASGFNPVGVTEALVALMKRAGFRSLSATVEGASTTMLRRMQKGFEAEDVARIAEWLPRHGIPAVWIFLIGSPGETLETVDETFTFIAERIPRRDLVYITNGVRVYRGTGLHRSLVASGHIRPDQPLLEPYFVFSASLPRDVYLQKLLAFARAHPNVVNSFEAGQPVVASLARLLGRLPLPRPRWRMLPLIRRFGSPFRDVRADALVASAWPIVSDADITASAEVSAAT
ncbi:MAG: radical SAM protein [Thermoanaerobaculia bacterium]